MYFSLVASALRCAVLCFLSTLLCLPTNCRWPTRVTGSSVTSGRQTSWLPALVNNPYRSVTDSEPTRVPSHAAFDGGGTQGWLLLHSARTRALRLRWCALLGPAAVGRWTGALPCLGVRPGVIVGRNGAYLPSQPTGSSVWTEWRCTPSWTWPASRTPGWPSCTDGVGPHGRMSCLEPPGSPSMRRTQP